MENNRSLLACEEKRFLRLKIDIDYLRNSIEDLFLSKERRQNKIIYSLNELWSRGLLANKLLSELLEIQLQLLKKTEGEVCNEQEENDFRIDLKEKLKNELNEEEFAILESVLSDYVKIFEEVSKLETKLKEKGELVKIHREVLSNINRLKKEISYFWSNDEKDNINYIC